MNKKFISSAVMAAAVAVGASATQAATLTFESIPGSAAIFNTSSEAGFDLKVSGLFLDTAFNGFGGSRSELEGLCCGSTGFLDVKKTGGGNFTFASVAIQLEYRSPASVTLQGYKLGILQGSDTFIASSSGYVVVGASGLAGVNIDQLIVTGQRDFGGGSSFDNLVLGAAAVPEPETYAMMLAGLGLLGLAARRRKQKAA